MGLTERLDTVIKLKNKADAVDATKDSIYLAYGNSDHEITSKKADDNFGVLVTLNSDIIRNTRELPSQLKASYLRNNVDHYISLMWATLHSFQNFVGKVDDKEIEKLLIRGTRSKSHEVRVRRILEQSHKLVYQIVPISMVLYMTDHLSNPKLARTVKKILEGTDDLTEVQRLFYMLLYFKLDKAGAYKIVKKIIAHSKSAVCDYIIYTYIRWYCFENQLTDEDLAEVLDLLEDIRNKYVQPARNLPPFVKDTFHSDVRKAISLRRLKAN